MKFTYTEHNKAAPPIKVPLSQAIRSAPETQEQFEARIEREFTEGSAIASGLYQAAIEIRADLETEAGGEATTPIHEALGWRKYKRFGHQARDPFYAALFCQEDGSTWQAKLSNPNPADPKDRGYRAPKGVCRALTPPIDAVTWLKVCLRNNVIFPQELRQWLDERFPKFEHKTTICTIVSSAAGITLAEGSLPSYFLPEEASSSGLNPALNENIPNINSPTNNSKTEKLTTQLRNANRVLDADFWDWAENIVKLHIQFTEGGKKALALLSRGYPAIAVYGVNSGYRSALLPAPELIPDLKRFAKPGRPVTLAFDADAKPKTIARVRGALKTFGSLLTKAGCAVRVATWKHEQGKGIDDLIVQSGGEVADEILTHAQAFSQWARRGEDKQESTQQWLGKVLAGLDVRVNWSQEKDKNKAIREARALVASRASAHNSLQGEAETGFFPGINLAESDRLLYALDGQKGTGKSSGAIKSLVEQCKNSLSVDRVAIFAPTRLLCASLAAVLGVPTIYEDNRASILVLCPESAYKLKGRDFDTIIVDEANEVLQRLAEGNLGSEPDRCREQFARILKGAKTIALAQDGLSKHTVETVSRLSGIPERQLQTLKRRREQTNIAIRLYQDRAIGKVESGQRPQANGAKFTWLFSLIEAIENGQRVVVPCGSQNAAREISRLLRDRFGRSKKVQVFDGRDSFAAAKTAFCQSPDGWLEENKIDVLIFTPCFNSGVSIESEYFDIQFEYATPFETAESISQRGERVRDSIWGSRIKERHIYLSYRGLAGHPDPVIFTSEYWTTLLRGDALGNLEQAVPVADAIGARAVLEGLKIKELARLETWRELPEMLAYQAFQIYFKREFLTQEWRGNGWEIETVPSLPDDALKELREGWREAKEGLISQRGRILAHCRNYDEIDPDCEETSGPIERTRLVKQILAQRTGKHEGLDDKYWLESWVIAPGDSGVPQLRLHALLRLAIVQPNQFQELQTWRALRLLGSASTLAALPPSSPVSDRELDLVALLSRCAAIEEIVAGGLTQWSKIHPLVVDAAEFARENAAEFARLSKHSQRIHGLQFTEDTPDIKCLHKLMGLIGLAAVHDGMCKRIHQYRLEEISDIEHKIDEAVEDFKPLQGLMRKYYRRATAEQFSDHLFSHFEASILKQSEDWDMYAQKVSKGISDPGSELQLGCPDRSTEVLIRPDVPLWLALSGAIRKASEWADFKKLGEIFPVGIKQRVWTALGQSDPDFKQEILKKQEAAT